MSQYQLSIPNKFHVDNKLFHNLMVRLWKYYQVTINNPHFTFLASCCNVTIQSWKNVGTTLWFGVVGSTLCRHWEYDLAVQRCTNCESNQLSNVEAISNVQAISEHLCNSCVDAVLCISCTTLRLYHNLRRCNLSYVVTRLRACWDCIWRRNVFEDRLTQIPWSQNLFISFFLVKYFILKFFKLSQTVEFHL